MYTLQFDEKALEYLEKLPITIRQRIFKKIQTTKENPYHYFEKLAQRKEYKLRVGDYRILADIDDKKILLLIIAIGHRKNIYKK